MTARGVIVAGLVLFGGAVYGIHTEKMRVVTTCRDARLFMDGGIDVSIEAGGINFHHAISVYRKHLRDEIPLGNFQIVSESSPGATQQVLTGPGIKFALIKDRGATEYGVPAHLEADIGKEKINVSLLCKKKEH